MIREAIGLSKADLARILEVAPFAVGAWESGLRNARADNVRGLAEALSCTTDDLWSIPTGARLAEIRAAYHQREADRAREEARAAS